MGSNCSVSAERWSEMTSAIREHQHVARRVVNECAAYFASSTEYDEDSDVRKRYGSVVMLSNLRARFLYDTSSPQLAIGAYGIEYHLRVCVVEMMHACISCSAFDLARQVYTAYAPLVRPHGALENVLEYDRQNFYGTDYGRILTHALYQGGLDALKTMPEELFVYAVNPYDTRNWLNVCLKKNNLELLCALQRTYPERFTEQWKYVLRLGHDWTLLFDAAASGRLGVLTWVVRHAAPLKHFKGSGNRVVAFRAAYCRLLVERLLALAVCFRRYVRTWRETFYSPDNASFRPMLRRMAAKHELAWREADAQYPMTSVAKRARVC